ncbi:uncharacterized protein LOC131667147 [Phymastichus coffea]|uniref:uncharacterized protein LOC131667147 n=1 Tax=Phymastichus coffea TaxID=108790 RepID=UPI00273ADAD0|nr:uncharacterized protein LOC131667147 [Phymastichus coffea]
MTRRLLPLVMVLLLLLLLLTSLEAVAAVAAAERRSAWKRSSSEASSVDYPAPQWTYQDAPEPEASEIRRRRKQRPRRPESEVYFVRLPPAPYSYVEGLGFVSRPALFDPASLPRPKPRPRPVVQLPVDFVSNGKPTKVYRYPQNGADGPLVRLDRGPYRFNGSPAGVYVVKRTKKPRRKPVVTSVRKRVVMKQ